MENGEEGMVMSEFNELLNKWWLSVGEMHIAHHLAASKYANQHKYTGLIAAILTAITTTSIFITVSQSETQIAWLITGIISLFASMATGILSFMKFNDRIAQHFQSAINFQSLRREIEEELIVLSAQGPKQNYEHLRQRWTEILKNSCPLPQEVFDKARRQMKTEATPFSRE